VAPSASCDHGRPTMPATGRQLVGLVGGLGGPWGTDGSLSEPGRPTGAEPPPHPLWGQGPLLIPSSRSRRIGVPSQQPPQLHRAVTRHRVPSAGSPAFWREVYPPCLGKFDYSTLPASRLPSSSWAQQLKPLRRRPEAQAPEEAYAIACNAVTHADADTLIREGEDG
jgi:hypothetical protein